MHQLLGEHEDQVCGIPIGTWLQMFFALVAARSFLQVVKLSLQIESVVFDVLRLLVFDSALFIWMVYGTSLYFSTSNNCSSNDASYAMNVMFVTTLGIGYLALLVYLFILVTLPAVYLKQRTELAATKAEREAKINDLIQSLSRAQYQDRTAKGECVCAICLQEYESHHCITQLPCNEMHYFHTACLETNIRQGNSQCPFCRQAIVAKQADETPLLAHAEHWEQQEQASLQ